MAVTFLVAPGAAAQNAPAKPGLEIDVDLLWTGGVSLEPREARLEAPGGGTLTLFSTTNELGRSLGPEVHVTFPLTRRLRVEATGAWSRAEVRSRITGDFEEASPGTSAAGLSIFSAEGAAVWLLPRRGRLEPFLRGGAGWLRVLTNDGVLSGDGVIANAGAGVKYWWREQARGRLKRLGLRSELRLVGRSSAVPLPSTTGLVAPAFTAGAILGF